MRTVALIALTLLMTGAPMARAKDTAQPKEKLICKNDTETGSRLRVKRICMSREDWNKQMDRTEQDVNDWKGRQSSAPAQQSSSGSPFGAP